MEAAEENMQKYDNYKEQFGRLKKAMNSNFYLEAVFIEYTIMEDRLESALRHSGKWKQPKEGQYVSIETKLSRVEKAAEEKKSLMHKYFSPELTEQVREWKEKRNKLVHALLKQSLHTEDLLEIAEEGQKLANQLCSKTTSFKRALEKERKKEAENSEVYNK